MSKPLRKDDPAQAVTVDQPASVEDIRNHPLFTGSEPVGMISAENPRFPVEAPGGHEALGNHLRAMGVRAIPTNGRYETPEQSYIVHGATREQMFDLGRRFGQESVVYSQNGSPEMLYVNGPKAGRFNPAARKPDGSVDYEIFDTEPDDYYTRFDPHGYLRLNFDWDTLHPAPLQEPHASAALMARGSAGEMQKAEYTVRELLGEVARVLRKSIDSQLVSPTPFPHAYPWFNSKTLHCMHHGHGGVFKSASLQKALGDSPEHQQNAGPTSSFAQTAVPFGSVQPGEMSHLHHYPLQGKSAQADQLVRDYGFQTHHFGGRQGRSDLDHKNYDTKWLPIMDAPHGNPAVEDHVGSWRKLHELAHALTEPDLDQTYGDGRRTGALGPHRTLREALRSVHWEWLAAHKQRDLARQMGVEIPEEDFNRELNTVMHDAVHRAVTGRVTDPSTEGFTPFSHKIPLETALSMVREHGHNLGLSGMHDLTKSEGSPAVAEKEYSAQEFRQLLAKAIRDRVEDYEKSLLELQARELAKAERLAKGDVVKFPGNPNPKKDQGKPAKVAGVIAYCPSCSKGRMGRVATADGRDTLECPKCGHSEDYNEWEKSELLPESKEIKAPGSGGQMRKGKIPGLKKADVPMAKPPTGNPMATPTAKPAVPKVQGAPTAPAGGAAPAPKIAVPKPPAMGKAEPPPAAGAPVPQADDAALKARIAELAATTKGAAWPAKLKPHYADNEVVIVGGNMIPNAPAWRVTHAYRGYDGQLVPTGHTPFNSYEEALAEAARAGANIHDQPLRMLGKSEKDDGRLMKGMPAIMGGNESAAAPAAAPKLPKMPSPTEHAARADMLQSFTPPAGTAHLTPPPKPGAPPALPASAAAPGAPGPTAPETARTTGLDKIRAAARQPLRLSEKDGAKKPEPYNPCRLPKVAGQGCYNTPPHKRYRDTEVGGNSIEPPHRRDTDSTKKGECEKCGPICKCGK